MKITLTSQFVNDLNESKIKLTDEKFPQKIDCDCSRKRGREEVEKPLALGGAVRCGEERKIKRKCR